MSVRHTMMGSSGYAASSAGTYIEDVFSTYLYNGTNQTQSISNGIDLSTNGGLVWIKQRSGVQNNCLFDTIRGTNNYLSTNSNGAQNVGGTYTDLLTSFNTSGFTLGADAFTAGFTNNSGTFASWTFRKQPKFFDVVTYTGDGGSNRSVTHNLGSTPGMIIVKSTNNAAMNWAVYHTSLGITNRMSLNTPAASAGAAGCWGTSNPTSTSFFVGQPGGDTNNNGTTYVAYVFANAAGGFGSSGVDNVITCGSFTTDGSGASTVVNLGYEPQFVLIKRANATSGGGQDYWQIVDNMRGLGATGTTQQVLFPNTSDYEFNWPIAGITSTGFATTNAGYVAPDATFIYMAIRRPMKTPTSGTSVFSPVVSSDATGTKLITNFPIDMQIGKIRSSAAMNVISDRLRGVSSNTSEYSNILTSTSNSSETTTSGFSRKWDNVGFEIPSVLGGLSNVFYNFKRATGFFDMVCYDGTGNYNTTIPHNLGVSPELMIIKARTGIGGLDMFWVVYCSLLTSSPTGEIMLKLNTNSIAMTAPNFFTSSWNVMKYPDSGNIYLGNADQVNYLSQKYVAYLFASCPGVSKIGSYTGNGTLQTINCGFTGGARFFLVKSTSTIGDWRVFDSARGITSTAEPSFLMNTTDAENIYDAVDPIASGIIVKQETTTSINASGVSYIYLAIS